MEKSRVVLTLNETIYKFTIYKYVPVQCIPLRSIPLCCADKANGDK